jgi:multisubunit Na+/H+ antiporter MnhG subunit
VSAANLAVDVLLIVGVGLEAACVLGVVIMPTTFDRLHFVGAATTVPAFCILAAVLCREHVSAGGIEAIAAVALVFLLFPILLTSTARVIRKVEEGDDS